MVKMAGMLKPFILLTFAGLGSYSSQYGISVY
jgi:hypothetical protein